jgi:ABC-type transport system substrate-binding protein
MSEPHHSPDLGGGRTTDPTSEVPRRRLSAATLGTALLLLIMVTAGLVAAFMVTPQPDEHALRRPSDSDVVLAAGPPSSWDPAVISDSASAQMLSQVFEGLTVLDAASEVRPALAESWSMADDGRSITFELREGLTFSDGSRLDAEDVRRSWLRVLEPDHPSPLASLLDDVAGAADRARGTGTAEDVGIRADGRALTVEFARPAAYFPAVAAVPTLAVVPEGIDTLAAGPREGTPFPASGPYVPLDGSSSVVVLEANDAYWAGPPPTRRITVVTDLGGRSEVDVFEDDAVDWTRISADDAAWIRYDERLGPQLRWGDEMVVEFLGFETTRPPFDDAAVRQAIAMAVDWTRLRDENAAGGAAVTSILPPGIAGRADTDFLPPHDPEAARAALAAAGYPGGDGFPTVSLATYGVGPAAAIAYELQRELGIDVEVEEWSFDDHGAILESDTPAMWTLAWSADYPHAHDFLGLLLRSDSSANTGGWSDGDYDALIEAAAASTDGAEQERLYEAAQAILRDEVPLIPLGYGSSWALSRDGLAGSDISGVGLVRYADLVWR